MQLNLENDYKIFDNKITLEYHSSKATNVNLTTGKMTQDHQGYELNDCLIRQISDRLSGTIRQIFERGKSVTVDSINMIDTVIEIPPTELVRNNINLEINDKLKRYKDGILVKTYIILGYDIATLESRWRAACRAT